MASALAAQPMPPLNRQVTVAAEGIPPQLPPAPVPVRPVDIAASQPVAAPPPPAPKAARPPRAAAMPAPTPVAAAPAHGGGGWRVQLGAYGSEAAAATAWSALTGKASGLRGLSPSYERAGAIVRLRAGGIADKAGATRACAAAKAAGAACFPVAP
jgi:cell division protein FtsN